GSLRAAIVQSNNTAGANAIVFSIPASTAANLNTPVPGFDPDTQTWTITPPVALPPITNQVEIDGFTEANVGVPYLYPNHITSSVRAVSVVSATGGTFTLSTSLALPVTTTPAIPYNPATDEVQSALESIFGVGNVSVTGPSGPVPP